MAMSLSADEETFKLHSLHLLLEVVEKQARLWERKIVLETSWADACISGKFATQL